ncbi:Crp/Fnr family transcriptional regulator [Paraflavitalea pollutisoli]|uniref:Crp/Fnr family transcriptional regulator n=1 Tax=Paraflavitalea pollutisoli TaxID=3034143 RepID=UPI0023EE0464|nr:Crp/Fnr family transcriptional regulator [Paraflavitalea sp. H1-2-19X]
MRERKLDIKSYLEHVFAYLQRFMELSRQDFDLLCPYLELRAFDKKVALLKEGEVEDTLNIVMKGMVRKYFKTKKGEATLQLATEGHIVQSEVSFHTRRPSDLILETVEPTVMITIRYDNLQEVLKQSIALERLARTIVTQMFVKKDIRYFENLQMTTRERFLAYVTNHPHMLQRVPQKILASYLNIKPETFSRLKHLLRRK